MKQKEAIFFFLFMFIIMKGFNETKKIEGDYLHVNGKKGPIEFKKYFKINFSFFIPHTNVMLFTTNFLQILERKQ